MYHHGWGMASSWCIDFRNPKRRRKVRSTWSWRHQPRRRNDKKWITVELTTFDSARVEHLWELNVSCALSWESWEICAFLFALTALLSCSHVIGLFFLNGCTHTLGFPESGHNVGSFPSAGHAEGWLFAALCSNFSPGPAGLWVHHVTLGATHRLMPGDGRSLGSKLQTYHACWAWQVPLHLKRSRKDTSDSLKSEIWIWLASTIWYMNHMNYLWTNNHDTS